MTPTSSSSNRLRDVFLEGIRRYKSVLILYAALLFVVGPVILVVDLINAGDGGFYGLSTEALFHFILLIAAVVLPLLLFSYINSRRAVDVYHALPVTRARLYWGNTLAGLFILLAPYLVLGAVCGGICKSLDAENGMLTRMVQIGVIAVTLYCVMVFIMVNCGTLFESITYFGILQIGYPLFIIALCACLGRITYGWGAALSAEQKFFMNFSAGYQLALLLMSDGSFHWAQTLQLLLTAAAALLGGMFLYQRRKSESAGSSFAFRPLFYIGALLISITAGLGFYLVLEGNAMRIPVAVIVGVLGYFILDTIRNRGLGGAKETALVCVGALAAVGMFFGVAALTGTFGFEDYLPPVTGVRSVQVQWDVNGETYLRSDVVLNSDESIQRVSDFHGQVVKNRRVLKDYTLDKDLAALPSDYEHYAFDDGRYSPDTYNTSTVRLAYTMVDGRKVVREYWDFPTVLTKPLYDVAGSEDYQQRLWAHMQEAVETHYMEKAESWNLNVSWENRRSEGIELTPSEAESLLSVMADDMKNRPADWNVHPSSVPLLEVQISPSPWFGLNYFYMEVHESDLLVLQWLKDAGFSTEPDGTLGGDTRFAKAESESGEYYRAMVLSRHDYDRCLQEGKIGSMFHFAGRILDYSIYDIEKDFDEPRYTLLNKNQYLALKDLTAGHYITEEPWDVLLLDGSAYLIYPENLNEVQRILAEARENNGND